jgi:hypothetical protein
MREAMPPLSQYAFMASWSVKKRAQGHLYFLPLAPVCKLIHRTYSSMQPVVPSPLLSCDDFEADKVV